MAARVAMIENGKQNIRMVSILEIGNNFDVYGYVLLLLIAVSFSKENSKIRGFWNFDV